MSQLTTRAQAAAPAEVQPTAEALATVTADSAVDLLRVALEKGVGVEALAKLVELHDTMAKRQAIQEFSQAKAAFLAECPAIHKGATAKIVSARNGTSFEFAYAALDDTYDTVRPLLDRYGFSVSWDVESHDKDSMVVACTLRHRAGHAAVSRFPIPVESSAGASPQMKASAAYSFAQRRTFEAVLGLVTTEEAPDVRYADPTPITDDQEMLIHDLIDETQADEQKFLKWLGVKHIADIRAVDYNRAINALRRKARKGDE